VVLARQGELLELGVQLVIGRLGAQIDIVHTGIDQVRSDHAVADDGLRLADAGARQADGLQLGFLTGAFEIGVQRVQRDLGVVVGLVLERAG
jgi:hypothetical protein